MAYINRDLEEKIKSASEEYACILITGARQVGKSTVLKQLMDGLNETESQLINMRYFQEKTQTEVAKTLGISQVQVSRLEKKLLLQMRNAIDNKSN